MRTWRDLRRAQQSGEESTSSPDPWAWMLAGDSKPGVHPKYTRFLEFNTIVERILTEDTDNDWDSIQRDCPDCGIHGGSPWDHYVYHRRGPSQTVATQADGAATTGERGTHTQEETAED